MDPHQTSLLILNDLITSICPEIIRGFLMVLGVQKLIRSRLMLQAQFGDNPFLVLVAFLVRVPIV